MFILFPAKSSSRSNEQTREAERLGTLRQLPMLLFLGTFKGNWNLPLLSARFNVMSEKFDEVARSSARRKLALSSTRC